MANLKIACWNVFFSHHLVERKDGSSFINPDEQARADRVGGIMNQIGADVLGIVECMPDYKLEAFRDAYLPGYQFETEGKGAKLHLGLLYNPATVSVARIFFNEKRWRAAIGYGGRERYYQFSRVPLIAEVRHLGTDKKFVLAVIHMKSKKTYTSEPEEPLDNRKKIVAQSLRVREIMADIALREPGYDRFLVMGDVNDGPGFDEHEAKIVRSGVETLAGDVFRPDEIYRSFVDLSGGGIPTTPFKGAPQLDHILYSRAMRDRGGPRVIEDSGAVRTDLVNFDNGSGKKTDSDHAPVEVTVLM